MNTCMPQHVYENMFEYLGMKYVQIFGYEVCLNIWV